jgi:hypothetical protein
MTKVFYRAILTGKVIPTRWVQPFFSQIMAPQWFFHISCFLSRNLGSTGSPQVPGYPASVVEGQQQGISRCGTLARRLRVLEPLPLFKKVICDDRE